MKATEVTYSLKLVKIEYGICEYSRGSADQQSETYRYYLSCIIMFSGGSNLVISTSTTAPEPLHWWLFGVIVRGLFLSWTKISKGCEEIPGSRTYQDSLANHRPKSNFTTTTISNRRNKSIFVIYDSSIKIWEILGIFWALWKISFFWCSCLAGWLVSPLAPKAYLHLIQILGSSSQFQPLHTDIFHQQKCREVIR
jgi:hypothetical protein